MVRFRLKIKTDWLETLKGNRFIFLIILILISSLVGLIYLQYYWVDLSYRTSRERFNQNVQYALSSVTAALVKNEALFTIRNQLRPDSLERKEDGYFEVVFDSMGSARYVEGRTIKTKQLIGSKSLSKSGSYFEVEQETKISRTAVAKKNELSNFKKESYENHYELMKTYMDTARMDSLAVENLIKKLNKSAIVVEVINSIINTKKKIEERVNEKLLDSLIRLELRRKGILQTYYFGVRNKSRESESDRFIFTNNRDRQYHILRSPYYINLFPNDLTGERNILYLELPEARNFVDQNLQGVLYSSIAFIVIIIGCFGYTIQILFRQQKLARLTKDFISNMTHEFKTPISTIYLATEALSDPQIGEFDRQRKKYLTIIRQENERLAKQVEKVLQISQIEKGDYQLFLSEIDLNAVVSEVVKNLRVFVEKRGGSISTQLYPQPLLLSADEHHIRNVLINLIENANKYSPEAPQILVETQKVFGGIKLIINDKGIGIPRDMLNKIFDKFFRVPTGNRHDVKGFGLGLSYVKQIVEAHGGSVYARSELGKGSSFVVFLPIHDEQS
jgi:two-component system phosphate regulon sensor histidine kinase PhoR